MEQLENIGTVLSFTGTKGALRFTDRNLEGTKRIVVTLVNSKNEQLRAILSESVSNDLRSKKIKAGQLMNLEMLKTDEGLIYIVQPAGSIVEIRVADLTIAPLTATEVDHSELIAGMI